MSNKSLLIYHLFDVRHVTPKCSQKCSIFILFPSFSTNPSQHSHLYYTHFVHVLLLDWPTFCSIGHSWSNCCTVKLFLLVSMSQSQTTPKVSLYFNHPALMFNIFVYLLILTNY
eukprot:TRINITY_DN191_c2_g1_i5.p1 TRINITY_DN191_c2_g1~~TRINITY_DN191_c2_g1_i5.p1  ORF type:complete len:114 (-),score=0.50 TRINITY_DN191_c2_g1_i5:264-605(-)